MLISLFDNVLDISDFEKNAKMSKTFTKTGDKTPFSYCLASSTWEEIFH